MVKSCPWLVYPQETRWDHIKEVWIWSTCKKVSPNNIICSGLDLGYFFQKIFDPSWDIWIDVLSILDKYLVKHTHSAILTCFNRCGMISRCGKYHICMGYSQKSQIWIDLRVVFWWIQPYFNLSNDVTWKMHQLNHTADSFYNGDNLLYHDWLYLSSKLPNLVVLNTYHSLFSK